MNKRQLLRAGLLGLSALALAASRISRPSGGGSGRSSTHVRISHTRTSWTRSCSSVNRASCFPDRLRRFPFPQDIRIARASPGPVPVVVPE